LLDKRKKRGYKINNSNNNNNNKQIYTRDVKKALVSFDRKRDSTKMKLTAAFLFALTSAEPVVKVDRKVPPRHPRNRLARLNIFCDYLFNKTGWINEKRTNGLVRFCNNWSNKMNNKINDSKCFFYDENQKPHGGPEPGKTPEAPKQYHGRWDSGMMEWLPAENRKRRQAEMINGLEAACWAKNPYFQEYSNEPENVQVCNKDGEFAATYIHPDHLDKKIMAEIENELCETDCVDHEDCSNECDKIARGSGDKKIARLKRQGPWKGARSILTGFRKFGERYLSQCHGHRAGTHMNRRYQFITRVSNKFLTHCTHEQCSRDYVESKNFKWGKKNLRTDYAGK